MYLLITICARLNTSACVVQIKEDIDQKMVMPNTDRSNISNIEAGNISNENAERRADMSGKPNFAEANAFDGPGPETINSRLVRMLIMYNGL